MAAQHQRHEADTDTLSPKLLVLDDLERTVLDVIAGLRYDGCTVDHVENTDAAAEALRIAAFDLIVVDQRLPSDRVRGGTSFMRALRSGAYGQLNVDTPFVLLTASSEAEDARIAESISGCLDTIQKGDDKVARIRFAIARVMPDFRARDERSIELEERAVVTLRRADRVKSDDSWLFEVDEWGLGGEEQLRVLAIELPVGVDEELSRAIGDVYVEASVNLAARSAAELRPRDFRLSATRLL